MNWTLEVVVIPISDVDRAKAFNSERLGFNVDDSKSDNGVRWVRLTPPGSGCSIAIGTRILSSGEPLDTEGGASRGGGL
jgi:hypothetical protein